MLETFRAAGIDLGNIELEVTEHALIDDYESAQNSLAELGRAGFSIAIDDFGVGYANLANPNNLPVRTIKIDKLFVQNVAEGNSQYLIIGAIVNLARSMGIRTIAEGVETAATYSLIREIGCDAAQGEW